MVAVKDKKRIVISSNNYLKKRLLLILSDYKLFASTLTVEDLVIMSVFEAGHFGSLFWKKGFI